MVQQLQNLVGPSPLEQLLGGFTGGFQQSFAQRQQAQAQQALQAQREQAQQRLQEQKGVAAQQQNLQLAQMLGIAPAAPQAMDEATDVQEGELNVLPSTNPPVPQESDRIWTQEQINAVTLQNPNLGKALQSQNDTKLKNLELRAKSHSAISGKYLEGINERAEGADLKEAALQSMKSAINEGDLGFFGRDNIANITGVEGLRTAKGAQFISSGKEFFLGSLKRAGARPNQWIEQQIQKMLPQIGRSKEANLTVAELLQSEIDIGNKEQELAHQIANDLEASLGFVPRDISLKVREQLKPFAKHRMELLEESLREIGGEVKLRKVEPGTALNTAVTAKLLQSTNGDEEKARELARKLGYDF